MTLSQAQIQQFKIDGYLILPKILDDDLRQSLRTLTCEHLQQRIEPFELEADVHYPGAPDSRDAPGGHTIRRLLMADRRGDRFLELARHEQILKGVQQILQSEQVWLNPNHHNCIMTKQPSFSSATLWHRDTRYWSFNNKYLINAWFALGDELEQNGAMKILPGSHRWQVREEALDEAQFLLLDHPDNAFRLSTARTVELNAGDALLFSAHCFHAAGKNQTDEAKLSAVFTYHGEETVADAETQSSRFEPIQQL